MEQSNEGALRKELQKLKPDKKECLIQLLRSLVLEQETEDSLLRSSVDRPGAG